MFKRIFALLCALLLALPLAAGLYIPRWPSCLT